MLVRITHFTIFVTVAGAAINMLNNSVYGIFLYLRLPVPFPGFPPADIPVCSLASDASSKCPIKNGDSYTEKVIIPVPGPDVVPAPVSCCIVYILCISLSSMKL